MASRRLPEDLVLRVEADEDTIIVQLRDPARKRKPIVGSVDCSVGTGTSERLGAKACKIGVAKVEPQFRSQGIGTVLYEHLAEAACANGMVVVSDDLRSKYADAFWKKQFRKGRVTRVPTATSVSEEARQKKEGQQYVYRAHQYVLSCPASGRVDLSGFASASWGKRR